MMSYDHAYMSSSNPVYAQRHAYWISELRYQANQAGVGALGLLTNTITEGMFSPL